MSNGAETYAKESIAQLKTPDHWKENCTNWCLGSIRVKSAAKSCTN